MATIDLPFINTFTDSRGKERHTFRRKGFKKVTLPGHPGSREFLSAYNACLGGQPIPAHKTAATLRVGTLRALAHEFRKSGQWQALADSSKTRYDYSLNEICNKHGDGTVADLPRAKAAELIRDIGARAPGVANTAIRVWKTVFDFAMDELEWRSEERGNPFARIEAYELGEHLCWTDKEIAKFESRWQIGTRERLGFALLLHTGQRVGDVAAMSEDDITDNGVNCVQEKTGTKVWIPIHPDLTAIVKATKIIGPYLFPTLKGTKIDKRWFGQLMAKAYDDAGLPDHCVSHGLRKAACRRLAQAGCTPHEIAAISGHKSLKEVERYTRAVDQQKSAKEAIRKLQAA